MFARSLGLAALVAAYFLLSSTSFAKSTKASRAAAKAAKIAAVATVSPAFEAEARLISIYKLIGTGQAREALPLAEQLTKRFPNFHLGHLVYGDLLAMQSRSVNVLGDLPANLNRGSNVNVLAELREESAQRVKALQTPPPIGTIPSQILGLTARNKHVIVVDASKSRLYLLENGSNGLTIVQNHYISVGKSGIGKYVEGDSKTPLGVYYLTTPINPKVLAPLYGGGALPINYPNPYDQRLGKSGSGIWLHGTMPERYSRQVKSTDGCVVMANPDLRKLMSTVAVKTTPVIISSKIQWVKPEQVTPERQQFDASINAWRAAKNTAQTDRMRQFYMADFSDYKRTLDAWWPANLSEIKKAKGRPFQWREVTTLMLRPELGEKASNVMVVTYDEVQPGIKQATTKRQYWIQSNNQWKIFFEGTIASS